MTVKDYLYSVRVSDKLIRTKEHELSKLRLNIAQVSVKQNEPVKTSGVNDPMRIVDRIADLQAEINREIDNLVRLKTEIRSKINALDDYRYINCHRWEDIAECMEMSVRHTLRLHGEALQAFRKKFDFS